MKQDYDFIIVWHSNTFFLDNSTHSTAYCNAAWKPSSYALKVTQNSWFADLMVMEG